MFSITLSRRCRLPVGRPNESPEEEEGAGRTLAELAVTAVEHCEVDGNAADEAGAQTS